MTKFAQANDGELQGSTPLSSGDMFDLPKNNPDQLFMIGVASRPGFEEGMQAIEYGLYPPDTPDNEKFELIISRWPDDTPMPWATIIVPMDDRQKIEEILKFHKLRLADGLPCLLSANGPEMFPIADSPNVMTIENIHTEDASDVIH